MDGQAADQASVRQQPRTGGDADVERAATAPNRPLRARAVMEWPHAPGCPCRRNWMKKVILSSASTCRSSRATRPLRGSGLDNAATAWTGPVAKVAKVLMADGSR